MRTALTILKYVPAVLGGLLALAWAVSLFETVGFRFQTGNGAVHLLVERSSLRYGFLVFNARPTGIVSYSNRSQDILGALSYSETSDGAAVQWRFIAVPICLTLTLLLPLSFGPFIRFRFPLWSWFVWTGLVAVECAYYLR